MALQCNCVRANGPDLLVESFLAGFRLEIGGEASFSRNQGGSQLVDCFVRAQSCLTTTSRI
jgi:hypothetical protein